ncbi:MAG: phosphotransferase, partial [Polaromonas sp.]|nr:phosphotransferase [Polaromonas sp.]
MTPAFAPDLFSGAQPVWKQASPSLGEIVRGMDEFLPADYLSFCKPPEQIDGLEINSNNIRLTSASGCQIVLKRYSDAVNISEIHKTLNLMAWLADEGLPVPKPLPFSNGNTSISHAGGQWVLFPFVEGEYFSGSQEELDAAAETVGILASKLSDAPVSLRTTRECHHFTTQDNEAIEFVQKKRDLWGRTFGLDIAELLNNHWERAWGEWCRIRINPPDPGPKTLAHLDLHPFNILVKDGKIAALLDFDSCKMLP